MKLITGLLPITAAFAIATAGVAGAQTGAQATAKVNGTTIPAYRLDAAVKTRTTQGQPDSPELRKDIREALITQEIVTVRKSVLPS